MQVSLSALIGTVSLPLSSPGVWSPSAGIWQGAMHDLNVALSSLTYTPLLNWNSIDGSARELQIIETQVDPSRTTTTITSGATSGKCQGTFRLNVEKYVQANTCTVKTGGTNSNCAAATADLDTCHAQNIVNTCIVVTGGGTNNDCAAAFLNSVTCAAATTSGGGGVSANACVFVDNSLHDCVFAFSRNAVVASTNLTTGNLNFDITAELMESTLSTLTSLTTIMVRRSVKTEQNGYIWEIRMLPTQYKSGVMWTSSSETIWYTVSVLSHSFTNCLQPYVSHKIVKAGNNKLNGKYSKRRCEQM